MSKYINFLQSESEYVQWVEISKSSYKHNNQNDQILMGCIYIPPEYSNYSSEEAFTEIEEEMLTFSSNTDKIALVGDFNSRTSNLSDIVIVDDNLFDILDFVISRSGMVK